MRTVTFKVISEVPVRESDNVFIYGNNEALSSRDSSAGVRLERISDTLWTKTFTLNEGDSLRFNFTLADNRNGMAVNSDGWITKFSYITVKHDTTVTMRIANWGRYLHSRNLRPDYFTGEGRGIGLVNNWKYHEGDNSEWAKPGFNDSLWKTVSSNFFRPEFTDLGWKGIGWFRAHLHVDSALWNANFGMNIQKFGTAEIYYNGRLLKFFGTAGSLRWDYIPFLTNRWEEFKIDAKTDQVIAVRYVSYDIRYVSYDADFQRSLGFDAGFGMLLMGLNQAFNTIHGIWLDKLFQMLFVIIPLILLFPHLFLYLFYRRQKQNLYYAIFLLGFAGLMYFSSNYEYLWLDDVFILELSPRNLQLFPFSLFILSVSTAIFFSMLTVWSTIFGTIPKRWLVYLALYIAVSVSGYLRIPWQVTFYLFDSRRDVAFIDFLVYLQAAIVIVEGVLAGFGRGRIKRQGRRIILTGFLVLNIFIILQTMRNFGLINLPGEQMGYRYGMLAFVIAMSLYLSYDFGFIHKNLEEQLVKVKDLSDKAIEQEKIQAALEVERRLVEADDLRKTKELESARDLQLSLLPKQVPHPDNLEIACYMKTSAEVGGDYYDFHLSEDGTFTAVIGDATGHGLKAGNMVILAKGLFNTLAMEDDLMEIIHSFNRSIKQMNLHMLTMCMALLRIKGDSLEYVSAGMPPMQIFRKEKCEVEELLLKGMPLGAFNDFPYKKISVSLCRGDVLLIMSDGLHEMFNDQKETYGMDRVVESFRESADKPPQEIIDYICNASRQWANEAPLEDDVTVMVIRVK